MITSAANDRLKHARRVREGRESGLIFIEGERLVEEALRSTLKLVSCLHVPDCTPRAHAILGQLSQAGVEAFAVEPRLLAALADTTTPQGIIVLAERPPAESSGLFDHSAPLIVGLDRIQDPGNFGTIIRTAEGAGASGIISLTGSADPFSPKCLRGAMGSAFRLPILSGIGATRALEIAHANNLCTVAAAGAGDLDYCDHDWTRPTLLWLGNEGRGLDDSLLRAATQRVRIPLAAGVESLNVAAAAAALLFEAARQRRAANIPARNPADLQTSASVTQPQAGAA